MEQNRQVLLVEDERHIADVVEFVLEEHGFDVVWAEEPRSAIDQFLAIHADLVLLDIGLPGMGGLALFQELRRRRSDLPVIMLTARSDEVDRVLGLELGADDYVTKPFSNRELAARVKAVLRRCGQGAAGDTDRLTCGPLMVEESRFYLEVDCVPVQLPRNEFLLLATLMRHPAHVFSREQLQRRMYGDEGAVSSRAVDTAVRRLRRKLQSVMASVNPIETVYGIGYRLSEEVRRLS